jgi:drug/metabolite transporter (DMT)-like permease
VVEVGCLLAFRAGGNISVTALLVNVAVAIVLVPVGLRWFGEAVSPLQIAGIAICLVGLLLINRR